MSGPTVSVGIDSSAATSGAQQFQNAAQQVANEAKAMDAAVEAAAEAFGAIAVELGVVIGVAEAVGMAFEAVQGVKHLADDFQTLQTRIGIFAPAGQQAGDIFDALNAAAIQARVPVDNLADGFSKTQSSMSRLGFTTNEQIQFWRAYTEAQTLSGVGSRNAELAMYNLVNAMNAGRMSGMEFRSLAHEMPPVMQLVADAFHVTTAQLKSMSSSGQIDMGDWVRAILAGKDKLQAQFTEMPQTISSAWQQLVGQVDVVTQKSAEQNGVVRAWAGAWGTLREAISGPAFKSAVDVFAKFVADVGDDITRWIKLFEEATLRQRAFASVIAESSVYQTFAAALDSVRSAIGGVASVAAQFWNGAAATFAETGVGKAFAAMGTTIEDRMSQLKALDGMKDSVFEKSDLGEVRNKPVGPLPENEKVKELRLQNEIIQAQIDHDKLLELSLKNQLETEKQLKEVMKEKDPILEGQIRGLMQEKAALEETKAMQDSEKVGDRLLDENLKLQAKLTTDKEISAEERAQSEISEKVTQDLRNLNPLEATRVELLIRQKVALEDQQKAQEQLKKQGDEMGRSITTELDKMITSGQSLDKSFKNLITSLEQMILKMTVMEPLAKAISQSFQSAGGFGGLFSGGSSALSGLFGGGSGGDVGLGSWAPTVGFASGGIFNSPIAMSAPGFRGVMGEAGPEAVMPLTRAADGSLGIQSVGGASASGGNTVHFNVQVAGDAADSTIAKMRTLLANSAPQLVNAAVVAVGRQNRADPNYLAR